MVNLLGMCRSFNSVRLDLMLSHMVLMELLMVNVSLNDVVDVRASCLSLSVSACRQRWIFLRIGFARCACADE